MRLSGPFAWHPVLFGVHALFKHLRLYLLLIPAMALVFLVSSCGLVGILKWECPVTEPRAPDNHLTPIQLALRYLEYSQVKEDRQAGNLHQYAGHWPECHALICGGPVTPDVSPFAATFVHHALSLVSEKTQAALGVTDSEIAAVRRMRLRAIKFMRRFESPLGAADAGTFGYWPDRRLPDWRLGDPLLTAIVRVVYRGPRFHGYRAPPNVSFFPRSFEIPSDADTTAVVYASMLDHARLDGGDPVPAWVPKLWADWRDLGQVPQRNNRNWIPDRSGAFLTWLAYRDAPNRANLNDLDVVVNINILYALGRLGCLDTPGADKAIQLVNSVIGSGVHLTNPNDLSLYYSDTLILHYLLTRAFREGNVLTLRPSVEKLVDDLLATVQTDSQGRRFWNRGSPCLNTAFGALALMNAGAAPKIVADAIDYLISRQDPNTGAWEAGVIVMGELYNGTRVRWRSKPVTTAWALEALCRHRLKSNRN